MIDIIGDFVSDEEKEIEASIALLLNTREGECALDRSFGLNWDFVDLPMPLAEAKMSNEIIEKVMKYEGDRAEVASVNSVADSSGTLKMKVVIECLTSKN